MRWQTHEYSLLGEVMANVDAWIILDPGALVCGCRFMYRTRDHRKDGGGNTALTSSATMLRDSRDVKQFPNETCLPENLDQDYGQIGSSLNQAAPGGR